MRSDSRRASSAAADGDGVRRHRTVGGAIQLLLAALLWVLLLRYRGLTPLVIATMLIEPLLRHLAGSLKPLETMGTAPGALLNLAVVPLLALVLYLSVCPARRPQGTGSR